MTATIDAQDLASGAEHPVLGPHYFAARKAAEKFMEKFEAEHFKPLVDKAAALFTEKLWTDLENHLLSDTESNLHSTMWRQIDASVEALLSGQQWALDRYVLADRYDCVRIREAVAKHIPAELADKRIADLEKEVADLKRALEYRR